MLIITLGDYESEIITLDPIAKSILYFGKLIHRDDCLRYFKIRSEKAFQDVLIKYGKCHDVIILNGHGTDHSFIFGRDKKETRDAKKFISYFPEDFGREKIIISLSCNTGSENLGLQISQQKKYCKAFIGPNNNLQGAIASQYCQTFLSNYLFSANIIEDSHKLSKDAIPGSEIMQLFI